MYLKKKIENYFYSINIKNLWRLQIRIQNKYC